MVQTSILAEILDERFHWICSTAMSHIKLISWKASNGTFDDMLKEWNDVYSDVIQEIDFDGKRVWFVDGSSIFYKGVFIHLAYKGVAVAVFDGVVNRYYTGSRIFKRIEWQD